MNRETALRIAQSRTVISSPTKRRAKVTTQPNVMHTDDVAKEGPSRYLVNVNLMSNTQATMLKQAFADADEAGLDDYQEVLKSSSLVGALNFTGSDGEVAPDWIPNKGEYVNVVIDKVFSKRQDKDVLGVVAIEQIPVETSAGNSFSLEDSGEIEVPADGALASTEG